MQKAFDYFNLINTPGNDILVENNELYFLPAELKLRYQRGDLPDSVLQIYGQVERNLEEGYDDSDIRYTSRGGVDNLAIDDDREVIYQGAISKIDNGLYELTFTIPDYDVVEQINISAYDLIQLLNAIAKYNVSTYNNDIQNIDDLLRLRDSRLTNRLVGNDVTGGGEYNEKRRAGNWAATDYDKFKNHHNMEPLDYYYPTDYTDYDENGMDGMDVSPFTL